MLTSLLDSVRYDFGYPFLLAWGHATLCATTAIVAVFAWWRGWRVWTWIVPGLVSLWAMSGALVMLNVGINSPLTIPTARFMPSGGKVIDLGAGSGRATVGLLLARPGTTVTALDLYSNNDYGIQDNTPERLHVNARIASVDDRVQTQVGDMRRLPFKDAEFDAAISSFAIDHLRREAVTQTLAETARVLRPDGQFLLIVIDVNGWTQLALPSIHGGGYFSRRQDPDRWRKALAEAGFAVTETGTQGGMLYFLAHKPLARQAIGR